MRRASDGRYRSSLRVCIYIYICVRNERLVWTDDARAFPRSHRVSRNSFNYLSRKVTHFEYVLRVHYQFRVGCLLSFTTLRHVLSIHPLVTRDSGASPMRNVSLSLFLSARARSRPSDSSAAFFSFPSPTLLITFIGRVDRRHSEGEISKWTCRF